MRTWVFVLFLGVSSILYGAFEPKNRPYDAIHYEIELELDPSLVQTEFSAKATAKIRLTAPSKTVSFDVEDLRLKKVVWLGKKARPLPFSVTKANELVITLPRQLPAGTALDLQMEYDGQIVENEHFGVFRVTDPDEPNRGSLIFTMFEPTGARRFLPCNDEPQDKATSAIAVTVPGGIEVLANGSVTKDAKFIRRGKPWHTVRWLQGQPHSTYLIAMATGKFSRVAAKGAKPEVTFWVGETKVTKAQYATDITASILKELEGYFGVPYPWPKYATIGLPTFLWSGMEHTSATFINQERALLNDANSENEKKSIAYLVAHELAHQWFGDYVTMKWWDDLWLNEAFASYLGTTGAKKIFANEEPDLEMVADTWDSYFRQENGPRSRPIVDRALTDPSDSFDAISYTKGENVLRMLNFYVGENAFRKGLGEYLRKHRFANATYKDFFAVMAKETGASLDLFRDSWLLQRGYPILTYSTEWDKSTKRLRVTVKQQSNHKGEKALFHFKLPLVAHRRAEPTFHEPGSLLLAESSATWEVTLPAEPDWVTVNPGGIALADVQSTGIDEDKIVLQASADPDPIARYWALLDLTGDFFDGGKLPSVGETAILKALDSDPSPYVRTMLLSAFQQSKSRWLPKDLGRRVLALAKASGEPGFEKTPHFIADPHGWRLFRSELLAALGRVSDPENLVFLTRTIQFPALPLDDLAATARAVAAMGDARSGEILREALKVHESRGYRFQYSIQFAFGAYESPRAAAEIQTLAKTAAPDLMGRIGWLIRDNQTLKNSVEWAEFLRAFVLYDNRFGEDVKARLLATIEEVKTTSVKRSLEAITKECQSQRLRDVSRRILDKNFAGE